ncbi:hypothetical protein HT585_09180 [Ensifer sp. HO-A22]|uniref:Uncharacterized protein n=2 Tax=Ensifer oleiphilus TaxID=2742698 RepID=A0A7Y6Q4R3_9HYPH|nr:hypothetical protein [Ensifer oleiphilus]
MALALASGGPAFAKTPSYCRTSFGPNDPIQTRFMGLDFELIAFALAEKYCGAEPRSMQDRFLKRLERDGCRPGTEIYSDTEKAIAKLNASDLKRLAKDANAQSALSDHQVDAWAAETVAELGGCGRLIELHDSKT